MWVVLMGLRSFQFSFLLHHSQTLFFSNYEETCLSFYYMTKYSIPQVLKPLFSVVWWNVLRSHTHSRALRFSETQVDCLGENRRPNEVFFSLHLNKI